MHYPELYSPASRRVAALRRPGRLAGAETRLPVLAVFAALSAGAMADGKLDQAFAKSSVVIEASADACYRFDAYLAEEVAQWRRGLMHVRHLDADGGMLFVYPEAGQRSMWMKNTLIPLDILFIRGDGMIAFIADNTEPLSLTSISPGVAVRFVLELNAGTAARLRIRPGDELLWAGDAVGMPSEN